MKLATLMKENPKKSSILLGLISVSALPPYYLFPILFFSLSTLLWLLIPEQKFKSAFAKGYWFGFAFFGLGFSWASNALLIDAAVFGWLYPISILASGVFFGFFIGIPAGLTCYFKTPFAKFLAFAAFWTVFEWIRSFFLTGFPWNLLGSSLAFSPITLQLASVIGTYGLSFLVVMLTTAPALFLMQSKNSSITALAVLITIPVLILGFGVIRIHNFQNNEESSIKVRMVQPAIPQNMKWEYSILEENLDAHVKLSQEAPLDDIDFVIWGETASPFPLDIDEIHMEKVLSAVPPKGYLITGLVRYEFSAQGKPLPYNSMFIIDPEGKIVDYYDKSHLVPFGEYIPFKKHLPDWIKPVTNTVANFQPGSGPKSIKISNYPQLGGLICYEIIFPSKVVNKKDSPQWLVNVTNDGWYGDSAGPHQHLVTTSLRAVEEGKTIVRVANSGISAAISPFGYIIDMIPLNQKKYIDIMLPAQLSIFTIYGSCGNTIPLILCLLNIILAIYISMLNVRPN